MPDANVMINFGIQNLGNLVNVRLGILGQAGVRAACQTAQRLVLVAQPHRELGLIATRLSGPHWAIGN